MTDIAQGGPLSLHGSNKHGSNNEPNKESITSDDNTGDQSIPLSCTDGSIQHNVAEGTTGRRERKNPPKDESGENTYSSYRHKSRESELL